MSDRIEFPEKLGDLTFVEEIEGRNPREGIYLCSCGAKVKRKLYNARAAKLRSIHSACKKCGRKRAKRSLGIRFQGAE